MPFEHLIDMLVNITPDQWHRFSLGLLFHSIVLLLFALALQAMLYKYCWSRRIGREFIKAFKQVHKDAKKYYDENVKPPPPPTITKMDYWSGVAKWARRCIVDYEKKEMMPFIESYGGNDQDKRAVLRLYKDGIATLRWRNTDTLDKIHIHQEALGTTKISVVFKSPSRTTEDSREDRTNEWKCPILSRGKDTLLIEIPSPCLSVLPEVICVDIEGYTFGADNLPSAFSWLVTWRNANRSFSE